MLNDLSDIGTFLGREIDRPPGYLTSARPDQGRARGQEHLSSFDPHLIVVGDYEERGWITF